MEVTKVVGVRRVFTVGEVETHALQGVDLRIDSGDFLDLLIGSEGTLGLITGLECRLAPLPGPTRETLEAAAVLGREFGLSTLGRMVDGGGGS